MEPNGAPPGPIRKPRSPRPRNLELLAKLRAIAFVVACAVQVFDLNVPGFRQAQSVGIDSHEQSAGSQIALDAGDQQALHLGHAVGTRDTGGTFGRLNAGQEPFARACRRRKRAEH